MKTNRSSSKKRPPFPQVKFVRAGLFDSLATTKPLAEVFSTLHAAMWRFEIALAQAEERCKIIPAGVADKIHDFGLAIDMERMAERSLQSATPAIPFVKGLTEVVHSTHPDAAGYVHWGATSQDLCDTAMVLVLREAREILESDLQLLEKALRDLAERHAQTVMLGRTLLQPAGPVTFGLKAAGWLAAIHRCHQRLNTCFEDALVLQFGGASGTLAALGDRGLEVSKELARELYLRLPEAPWHTHRDRLAALLCALGVLTGELGKMARDISLLMQSEVAEASEPSTEGRGGSSAMPHKQNPVGCAVTLAAAQRVPGLVSSFLSSMVQEHERALGGWQAEWPIIAGVVQSSGVAIAAMAEVAEGLTVDAARMRANIKATRGVIFAERAAMLLGEKLGRDAAHKIVESAVRKSTEQQRSLSEVLAEMPEVKKHLTANVLRNLETPEQYLGVTEEFRKRLLSSAKSERPVKTRRRKE